MTAKRYQNAKPLTPADLAGKMLQLPKGESGLDSAAFVEPRHGLDDLLLTANVRGALDQVLLEHAHAAELVKAGCAPACRLLFDGPPGTGKTSAAGAIARALEWPFVVARQHELVNSHMGESSKAVARLFDFARDARAVVLLDEFDSVATSRGGDDNSSAGRELNTLVTTILSMLDRHTGPGIIIAATNRPDALDAAAVRRFDLQVTFELPDDATRAALVRKLLGDELAAVDLATGSHADIARVCMHEKKRRVLAGIVAREAKRAARRAAVPELPPEPPAPPMPGIDPELQQLASDLVSQPCTFCGRPIMDCGPQCLRRQAAQRKREAVG